MAHSPGVELRASIKADPFQRRSVLELVNIPTIFAYLNRVI